MKKKLKLGKVILNYKGYSVRPILVNGLSNGEFGIYAGKKLASNKGIAKPTDAISLIEDKISENKRIRLKAEQDHSRKMKELNLLTRRVW